jgi:hypothetical protein
MLTSEFFLGRTSCVYGDLPSATDRTVDDIKQYIYDEIAEYYTEKNVTIDFNPENMTFPHIDINPDSDEEDTQPTEEDTQPKKDIDPHGDKKIPTIGLGYINKCVEYFFMRFAFYICFHFLLDATHTHQANISRIPFTKDMMYETDFNRRGGSMSTETSLLVTQQLFLTKLSIDDILGFWTNRMKGMYKTTHSLLRSQADSVAGLYIKDSSERTSVFDKMYEPLGKLVENGYFSALSTMFSKLREHETTLGNPTIVGYQITCIKKARDDWIMCHNSVTSPFARCNTTKIIAIMKEVCNNKKYGYLTLDLNYDDEGDEKRQVALTAFPWMRNVSDSRHAAILGNYDKDTKFFTVSNSWGHKYQYTLVSSDNMEKYLIFLNCKFVFISNKDKEEIRRRDLFF